MLWKDMGAFKKRKGQVLMPGNQRMHRRKPQKENREAQVKRWKRNRSRRMVRRHWPLLPIYLLIVVIIIAWEILK
jgi:cell division septal protein FtsQ